MLVLGIDPALAGRIGFGYIMDGEFGGEFGEVLHLKHKKKGSSLTNFDSRFFMRARQVDHFLLQFNKPPDLAVVEYPSGRVSASVDMFQILGICKALCEVHRIPLVQIFTSQTREILFHDMRFKNGSMSKEQAIIQLKRKFGDFDDNVLEALWLAKVGTMALTKTLVHDNINEAVAEARNFYWGK